ncbi:hypothetical protein [Prescottella equi]
MPKLLTDSELAIVQSALVIEPGLTTIRLGVERLRDGSITWHDTAVVTVGRMGRMEGFELDSDLIDAFAADHPATGPDYAIEVTAMVRAAALVRYLQRPAAETVAV